MNYFKLFALILLVSLCRTATASPPPEEHYSAIDKALSKAILAKDKSVALRLLNAGTNPNITYSERELEGVDEFVIRKHPILFYAVGWTPQMPYCYGQVMRRSRRIVDVDSAVVKKLLDVGAGKALKPEQWEVLLRFAVRYAPTEVATLLLSDYQQHYKTDYSYLLAAAAESLRADNAKVLLPYHVNVNIRNDEGETPLITVEHSPLIFAEDSARKLDTTRLLLNAHADINAQDKTGMSALMWAVIQRQTEIVRLLLEYGADPLLKEKGNAILLLGSRSVSMIRETEKGRTALDFAAGCDPILNILRQNK